MFNNDMALKKVGKKFIKKITKEGERKVINVPKEHYNNFDYGDDVLVSKLNLEEIENDTRTI